MKFPVLSFCLSLTLLSLAIVSQDASAQLRIVTYNTNTFGTEANGSDVRTIRDEADIVIQAIGEEVVNGFARPADIIMLQEQQRPNTTTQDFVNRLNNIYNGQGITYARGFQVGQTIIDTPDGSLSSNEIRQSVVYRTDSVSLISEDSFGALNGTTLRQPRETLMHQFRPVGYGASADLFVFNGHWKASDGNANEAQRETEADQIRNYIDSNGLGNRNVIVGGDFNVSDNFSNSGNSAFNGQSALEILSAAGPGRVLDPLFPDNESVNFSIYDSGVPNTVNGVDLASFLTQSPSGQGGALVGGGIDDRFDFLLNSDELLDDEGVSVINGSLRTFGNNGSTGNTQINDGNTIEFDGVTSFTDQEVLDALEAASDHLPVVQDFQIPSVLEAQLVGTIPTTVEQGSAVDLLLAIRNAADVLLPQGADELDFQFSTMGDLFGSETGVDDALGSVFNGIVSLDTTQLGTRSGVITVSSNSQDVANGLFSIPVSFEVVAAIPEPGSITLTALIGVALATRRRR